MNKGDSDEELNELPVENDEIKFIKTEVVTEVSSQPCEKERCGSSIAKVQAELKTSAIGNLNMQTSKTDQLFEKMVPAFVKNLQKFNGNPLEFSKFKAAFNVEVDKREVYDATEKLKFLLDSVEGSVRSCLAKFMRGSDKYEEAWTALQERFGRVDTVVSAGKKHHSKRK